MLLLWHNYSWQSVRMLQLMTAEYVSLYKQVGKAYSMVSPQLDQLRLGALGSQLSAPDS